MVQRLGTRLFVSRLSFFTTDSQLRKLFSQFGIITEARLVKDPKTQRPKGFGFVSYESEIEAEKAMNAMNGRVLKNRFGTLLHHEFTKEQIMDGRLIFVEPAKATRPKDGAS